MEQCYLQWALDICVQRIDYNGIGGVGDKSSHFNIVFDEIVKRFSNTVVWAHVIALITK